MCPQKGPAWPSALMSQIQVVNEDAGKLNEWPMTSLGQGAASTPACIPQGDTVPGGAAPASLKPYYWAVYNFQICVFCGRSGCLSSWEPYSPRAQGQAVGSDQLCSPTEAQTCLHQGRSQTDEEPRALDGCEMCLQEKSTIPSGRKREELPVGIGEEAQNLADSVI